MRFVILLVTCLVLAACDKAEPAAEPETTATDPQTSESVPTDAEEPAKHCDQAYKDLVALVEGLEEQLGSSDSELPERAAFVESCQSLPADVQQCMVFEYGMANQDECQKRIDGLDPEQKKRAEELMGK